METLIRAGFKRVNRWVCYSLVLGRRSGITNPRIGKKTNAVEFHDRIAAEFNKKYQFSKAFRERFQVWTELFNRYITPTDRVIDLGCGSGIFSNYLAGKGCDVTGLDGSAAMIALCKQHKTTVQAQYSQASLPLIDPLRFAHQDVVLLSSVLEYLTDPAEMLAQVGMILRPNGLLFVSIPNQQSIYRMIEQGLFRLTGRPAYMMHSQCTMPQTVLTEHLIELGFERLETTYFSALDPVSRTLKPFFAEQYVNNLVVGVYRKRA